MPQTDIPGSRLDSQHIAGTKFNTVKDLVGWMGAMQAQDPQMIKWAIGVRLPGITEKEVEEAIDRGDVIRTHLLRPTWHLVTADDIHWILELTAPRLKTSMRSRLKQLGLTEDIIVKSNHIIEKALGNGNHLTRPELMAELQKANIPTNDNRSSHLMMRAELDGIVCSGAGKGKQTTYALLEERVPKRKTLGKEEALAKLAGTYFTSHCPATLEDFTWWSGLTTTEAKQAIELIKPRFVEEKIGPQTYLLPDGVSLKNDTTASVHAIPAFDEFLISYKDRSASLPEQHLRKAVSNNGIFWPVITVNGKVSGTWKRSLKKDKVVVETRFFHPPGKSIQAGMERAFAEFGRFLGKEIQY